MKLLHRLLATAGLAALLGPAGTTPVAAAQLSRHPAYLPPATKAVAGQAGATAADRAILLAMTGHSADPGRLIAALPAIVQAVVDAEPGGMKAEQVAGLIARRSATALAAAGVHIDPNLAANLATEIVATVERAFAAQGVVIDRVAVASAALDGLGTAGSVGLIGSLTAGTGLPATERDHDGVFGLGQERNSAY